MNAPDLIAAAVADIDYRIAKLSTAIARRDSSLQTQAECQAVQRALESLRKSLTQPALRSIA